MFYKFFSHYKWNGWWLLAAKIVYMRCPTSSQTTSDLGSQEIGKSKENLKTA